MKLCNWFNWLKIGFFGAIISIRIIKLIDRYSLIQLLTLVGENSIYSLRVDFFKSTF
jgi:hypothetical protein